MFAPKIACQTLPYSEFPFERAVQGIAAAGYPYFSFGVTHQGQETPSPLDPDATVLGYAQQVRDAGMEPVMMFRPRAELTSDGGLDLFKRRVDQAKLIGVEQVLAWGPWGYKSWPEERFSDEELEALAAPWYEAMALAAKHAEDVGVTIVFKPHTGVTATAALCRRTVERIGSPAVAVCYDGGNVSFYEGIDPAEDIKACAEVTRALCVKDHVGPRANALFPCPGDGEVDHESMLRTLAAYDFAGPVAVERFEGHHKKADMSAELVDKLAAKAYQHLRTVVERISAEL